MKLIIGSVIVSLLMGCAKISKFEGYRENRMTPEESRQPSPQELEYLRKQAEKKAEAQAQEYGLGLVFDADQPAESPTPHSEIPFTPTEYRRVYIYPHTNHFGDAVNGHMCSILYAKAQFHEQPQVAAPPTAPVIMDREQKVSPLGRLSGAQGVTPTTLRNYLLKQGIGQSQGRSSAVPNPPPKPPGPPKPRSKVPSQDEIRKKLKDYDQQQQGGAFDG